MSDDSDLPLHVESIPPRTASEGASPAVFVLHGRGADERDLVPVARRFPDDLHVLSLRAPDRLQGGYTWYELDLSGGGLHQSQPHSEEFRRSLDAVWETVERAVSVHDLDADRVGLFGFSQGAITSLSTLVERSDDVSWVAASHGYLADEHASREVDLSGTPAFVGAGAADQVIPPERCEAAADRLREWGADVRYGTYQAAHGIGQEELSDLVSFVEEVR